MFRERFNHRLNQRQLDEVEFSKIIKDVCFYFFKPDFLHDDELWSIQGGKLYNVLAMYREEKEFIEALTSKDLAIVVGNRASGKSSFINILSRLQEFEGLYIIEIQCLSHVPRKLREHAGIVIDLKRDGSESLPYLEWLENYKKENLDIANYYPFSLEKGKKVVNSTLYGVMFGSPYKGSALEKRADKLAEKAIIRALKEKANARYGILFEPSDKQSVSEKLNPLRSDLNYDIYTTRVGELISLLEKDADNEDVWMVIRKIRKLIKERKEVEETINKIKRLEERHNGKM